MFKLFLIAGFWSITQLSMASSYQQEHDYITNKISEYMLAYEECHEFADNRELPEDEVVMELKKYEYEDVERFLIARGFLSLKECTKKELTELAYSILILEESELKDNTKEAISAIKVLAFPSQNREFEKLYESLPKRMKESLEEFEYFSQPFDNRKLRDTISTGEKP